ncbi:hypothetical protein, partial [Sphingobium baderi]
LFCDAMKAFSRKSFRDEYLANSSARCWYLWVGLGGSCLSVPVVYSVAQRSDLGLIVPLAFAVFFQESLLRAGVGKYKAYIALSMVEISLLSYALFLWSGYGRLAVASLFLLPFAVHSAYRPTILRFWHFVVALPVLVIIANVVRGGAMGDVTSNVAVGVTDHMRLTEDLRSGFYVGSGQIQAFVDQYLLFFLNWFPRDSWPTKPIGAGLYAVDLFWGRSRYGEDHNVSLGFVGDQIFTLGGWYILGLFAILATIIVIRHTLARYSGTIRHAPLIAFDAMLLTYFWGGMASFGARVWFAVLPLIALALISRVMTGGGKKGLGFAGLMSGARDCPRM